jgi:hypothetical protein
VTPEDWLLGMSDLTGELMRYATNGESLTFSDLERMLNISIEYRRPRDAIGGMRVRQGRQNSCVSLEYRCGTR